MKSGSFRHGTEEGFKKFKCPCVKCVNWENQPEPNEALREAARENADLLTRDAPSHSLVEGLPPSMDVPDIVPFLRSARFNRIDMEIISGEWAATITAYGDRFVGFGHLPDHALYNAIKRYHGSDPRTGPITVTLDQSTSETSIGRALSTEGTEEIEKIWEDEHESSGNTLEGLVFRPEDPATE